MATTTPWRRAVTPHDNIRQGRVKQNDFAACLADVLGKSGNPDYFDPVRFFNRTYLTIGLRQLAGEVVGRLTGQGDGDAVLQIQTPFGGGKTHTLICLYHLVKNGQACFDHEALKAYWLERGWNVPPSVPVAAFDGNQVGVGAVELEPGISVQTMWGHVAWQLAGKEGYRLVASFDADRVAPGGDDVDKLFEASGGGLVILDEVVNYIEKAAAVAVEDSTLRAQTLTFLQTLTVRAGAHDRVVVAATLPKSHLELHGTASADALDRLQKIFGRVQKVHEPVEGGGIHEIIRRRLFEDIGAGKDRKNVIEAYVQDLKGRPQIPEDAREASWRRRFEESYPFHPFFLDILIRYVAANPKFQRTRGALRILSLTVADLLQKKHDGGLIHPSDVDLTNEEIRSELLELVDREFRSALEADIIGAGSNAGELDRQSPLMTEWRIAGGLATTAFLFTCEAGNSARGATLGELHLASGRPEIDYGTIPGVIAQMKERFHFINTEGDRFRFSTTPNLNRILLDAKNSADDEQVRERLEAELRKLLTPSSLSPYIWPEAANDVPDSSSNKLVMMPPETTIGGTTGGEGKSAVLDILTRSGSTHRTNRNTLVFVLPDENEVPILRDRVRGLLAAENVDTHRERYNLSQSQITQLATEKSNAARGVRQQILRGYRHVAWGGSKSAGEGEALVVLDMGQPPVTTEQNLADLVVVFLKEKQKYLEQIASILLVHPTKLKVWPDDEDTLSLKALPGYFRSFTHLPILRDDDVLKQAVVDGVRSGQFALAEGTSGEDARILHFKEAISPAAVALEEGYVLIRQALAEQKIAEEEAARAGGTAVTVPSGAGAPSGIAQPEGTQPGATVPGAGPGPVATGGTGSGPSATAQRVRLDVEVPFTDFHSFYTGIINALGRNADDITIRVRIEASSENGFSPTLIEDTVKETLFNLFRTDEALEVDE